MHVPTTLRATGLRGGLRLGSALLLTAFLAVGLPACDEDNDEEITPSDALIDPTDADAISRAIDLPDNAVRISGTPPAPTTDAPSIDAERASITSANGATALLGFGFADADAGLGGCYIQVDGSDQYVRVPYTQASDAEGEITLPIGIPANTDAGTFCLSFCVYDADDNVSNIETQCIDVLRLGTGALQISLSWDNESDQDLYVTTPAGEVINYIDETDGTGGALDRDDTDGFGPENIFWLETAPNGQYTVEVDDYDDTGANVAVTINSRDFTRTFNATTSDGEKSLITRFTKTDDGITF